MTDLAQPLHRLPAIDLIAGNVLVTSNIEWVVDEVSRTRYGIHVTAHNDAATGVFTYGPSDMIRIKS